MSNLTSREDALGEIDCPWCGHERPLGTLDFSNCIANPLQIHRCECKQCHHHFIVSSFVTYSAERANET